MATLVCILTGCSRVLLLTLGLVVTWCAVGMQHRYLRHPAHTRAPPSSCSLPLGSPDGQRGGQYRGSTAAAGSTHLSTSSTSSTARQKQQAIQHTTVA